jgi:flavodoxin
MKVGIIVYSKTGNTLQVAERIRAALIEAGLHAEVQRFSAETENAQSNTPVRLTAQPDPNEYDAVIFGAPVQAFSLEPAMSMYLKQIGTLKNVSTLCFVTQHFKKAWMGGNRAMKQLLAQLHEKGVAATAMGVVNWSGNQREVQIDRIAIQCVKALKR